ncbi:MAG: hypothetical protein H2174_06105 [Vampirovibrio sp.]|nr:hypothetical protein [Vampirovibrio sp.]
MDKLSAPYSEIITTVAVIGIVSFFIFVVSMIVMQAIGYKKILKQVQSYNDVVANTPELRKYLDQGYQLLTIIPQDSTDGYTFTTGVFDYPSKSQINALALFFVEHTNPKPETKSFTLKGVFQTEMHNRGCSSIISDYTQQLPLTAATDISFEKGLLSPDFTFGVKKDDELFLQMSLPSISLKGVSLEDAYKITCSHIPESQQWQWDCTKQQTNHYRLLETNSNRVLLAMLPACMSFAKMTTSLSYLLVHPEMPKALVPVFVELGLQARRKRSNSSD